MATPDIAESSTETRSVVHRLKHTWSISNFSHLANTESEYPSIYSEVFQYPQDRRIEFYLQLYPSGTDATMKDYISVYLHSQLKVEGALVLVQCKLSLLNGRNEVGYSKGKGQLSLSLPLKLLIYSFKR